ncbi:MAG: iron uptake porin [Hormoscilla sp.]
MYINCATQDRKIRGFRFSLAFAVNILSLCLQNTPTRAAVPSQPIAQTPPELTVSSVDPQGRHQRVAQLSQPAPKPTRTLQGQVTSVNQLVDVRPTDWAFQALQSLVERYGAIAGYPNGQFGGNRPISRYEFAAGLNTALDRINELIAAGLVERIAREDVVVLQRLQEEFAVELATLRGRVDALEARTAELEANQFSTTTVLRGLVVMALNQGGFAGDRIRSATGAEITTDDPNATILYRSSLDFNTSFTGTDLLRIILDFASNGPFDNAAGVLEPNLGSILGFTVKPPTTQGIGRLYYDFTPLKDLRVSLGPGIVPSDYIDRNSYANIDFVHFGTLALVNNYVLFPIAGVTSGAALHWNPKNGPIHLRAIYSAVDAGNSRPEEIITELSAFSTLLYPNRDGDRGLFGDFQQTMAEVEYKPSQNFALRLQYSGGEVFDERFDAFGVNFELGLSSQLGLFGRYGYSSYNDTSFGDINPNYWMAGVGFRDLFMSGALAGIAATQPFIATEVGNGTQTNYEVFYNFPVNDNIRITPLVQVVVDPGNQQDNGTIVTGTLRMVFGF